MQFLPGAFAPMANYAQFMLYKLQPSRRAGKMDKLPVNAHTGQVVSAHDAAHWLTADAALALLPIWGEGYRLAFVFTDADPFYFVDIDGCIDDAGEYSPLALQVMGYFPGCAVEVSQSGRGLHIFGSGAVPEHACRNDRLGLEFYTEGRFVALTGQVLQGDAGANSPYVAQFVAEYMPAVERAAPVESGAGRRPEWNGPEDDAELIAMALRSKSTGAAFGGKASFAQLWAGDVGDIYAGDASAADMALASHLAFWTGCDAERMERLMRMSGLAREKWDAHSSYLQEFTIGRAVASCKDVYHRREFDVAANTEPQVEPGNVSKLAPVTVEGVPIMSALPQIDLFAGCAYVLDRHEIFSPAHGMLDQGRFKAMFGGYVYVMDAENRKFSSNAWDAFTNSTIVRFPRVHSTCFRPEIEPGAVVSENAGHRRINVYKPWPTRRVQGDASPFLGLLERLLPVERDRTILISYMAAVLQYPGVKFQWWPVIQGVEGNGKTLVLTAMRMAVGEQYCFAPNVSEIAKGGNKFNGWVEHKLFLAMEEVYVPERRTFLEEFKTTITNDWLPIERKGVDQVMGDNRANGIMSTNHRDGVPITLDGRRYCIFFTAQQCKDDLARDGMGGGYFPDLYDWCHKRDGWAIINEYLRTYEIAPEFNPAVACKIAPRTSSTDAALAASLGSVEQAIQEAVEEGTLGMAGGWISSHYLDVFLRDAGLHNRAPFNRRKDMLAALGYVAHPLLDGGRARKYVTPDGIRPRLYVRLDSDAFRSAMPEEDYSRAQLDHDLARTKEAFKR